jgi:hypothetical protein
VEAAIPEAAAEDTPAVEAAIQEVVVEGAAKAAAKVAAYMSRWSYAGTARSRFSTPCCGKVITPLRPTTHLRMHPKTPPST